MSDTVLLTGFEPFAEWRTNPSGEVARRLDGATAAGALVVGRVLPVNLRGLEERLRRLLDEVRPVAVVATGLAPASPVVRLERFAVNLADFRIPDGAGEMPREVALAPEGAVALASRLPLGLTLEALLTAGIPAVLSNSAGTYLCNALMYTALAACERHVPAGFVHLPNTPEQVAAALAGPLEPSPGPSMGLETMTRAIEIVLAAAVEAARPASVAS